MATGHSSIPSQLMTRRTAVNRVTRRVEQQCVSATNVMPERRLMSTRNQDWWPSRGVLTLHTQWWRCYIECTVNARIQYGNSAHVGHMACRQQHIASKPLHGYFWQAIVVAVALSHGTIPDLPIHALWTGRHISSPRLDLTVGQKQKQ